MAADAAALCEAGAISPETALARLVLAGADLAAAASRSPRLADCIARHAAAPATLAAMRDAAGVTHDRAHGPEAIRAMFDRAVEAAPEASVAAYALNDPALLAAATAELIAFLDVHTLLGPTTRVLDWGSGIGRVAASLAPRVGHVLALDLSPAMIAEARRRHPDLANVVWEVTDGRPPWPASTGGFDLVLAVDSFPYLADGALDAHFAEALRCTRPGGAVAVFNLRYGPDEAARAAALADAHGATLAVAGLRPFRLWDGAAYLFRASA